MTETRTAFVNDRFLPEEQAVVSIFDRGFLYGDGIFATIRICNGRPFRWRRHLLRLKRGAEFLRIELPTSEARLREVVIELARLNNLSDATLRLTLSRGRGPRGYSPTLATNPTLTMTIHPLPQLSPGNPPVWRLATSTWKLHASDPLAWFKSCNRLVQVLARGEAEAAGFDEALLLNEQGHPVETASGNLFWMDGETPVTAPLGTGILPGVTRSVLFEVAEALGRPVQERNVTRDQLLGMSGAFISMSGLGVVEISALDEHQMARSQFVPALAHAYNRLVSLETAGDAGTGS